MCDIITVIKIYIKVDLIIIFEYFNHEDKMLHLAIKKNQTFLSQCAYLKDVPPLNE